MRIFSSRAADSLVRKSAPASDDPSLNREIVSFENLWRVDTLREIHQSFIRDMPADKGTGPSCGSLRWPGPSTTGSWPRAWKSEELFGAGGDGLRMRPGLRYRSAHAGRRVSRMAGKMEQGAVQLIAQIRKIVANSRKMKNPPLVMAVSYHAGPIAGCRASFCMISPGMPIPTSSKPKER